MRIIRTQNGISIILAVIALMMLSALGLGIMSMTVIESRTVLNYNDHVYAIYLAEAGIERGIAAIKSSVPGGGVTRDSAADAYYQHDHSYDMNINKNHPNRLWELEKSKSCLAGDSEWGAGNWGSDQYTFALSGRKGVTLRGFIDFDDAVLRNSALTGPVSVVIRNRWQNGTPHMYVSWCNDNDDPCQYRSEYEPLFNVEYSNSSVTPENSWELYSAELCAGSCAGWTWDDLSNLYVRITNNHASAGSSNDDLDIDHVYVRFPRPVDNSMGTLLSGWTWNDTSGSYQSGLLNLGRGTVETEIVAPSSGVNVNYANQRMLEQLFDECNLGSLSDNVAEDLIAWRSSNGPFTSNGQVRQVLTNDYGYSDETVDKFIDYIAVLSYVDSQVYKNDN
ncbi:MAG: hypothetical protein GY868_12520, partial [Deltaproteobacteria bacterium]|nr:hypothetical protein [Deltaproteobacteria bacterium]